MPRSCVCGKYRLTQRHFAIAVVAVHNIVLSADDQVAAEWCFVRANIDVDRTSSSVVDKSQKSVAALVGRKRISTPIDGMGVPAGINSRTPR